MNKGKAQDRKRSWSGGSKKKKKGEEPRMIRARTRRQLLA